MDLFPPPPLEEFKFVDPVEPKFKVPDIPNGLPVGAAGWLEVDPLVNGLLVADWNPPPKENPPDPD